MALAELGELDSEQRLQEEIIYLIRQSEAIQLERVNAFLDGVVLAAEQVQDIRLALAERQAEPAGWETFAGLMLTFVLESNFAGKIVKEATSAIFKKLVGSTEFFLKAPKSPKGVELIKQAERLAQINIGRRPPQGTIRDVVRLGASGLPGVGIDNVSSKLELYHDSIVALANGEVDPTNVVAAAKAVREGKALLASAGGQALATNDSAGVVIVGNAREYAANTRLALRIRHARTEALVRAGAFTPASLREIVQVFEPGELKVDLNGRSVPLNLAQLRNHYRLLFEAVIWARLYNFVPNKSPPIRVIGAEFDGIRKDLSDYWRDRFADLLDAWTVQKGKTRFRTVAPGAQIVNLRDYFWEMVQNLPKLRDGELNRRVR